ncbi:MAG: aldo/keto reductase [Telmatospirillum sp.]|nr:aldo/keto reductase [Telmatospirillum sp.]
MAAAAPLARTVRLADGAECPAFGMGTWRMGEAKATRAAEIEALKAGLDAGVKLIDTAEMYGEGEAETIVAAALAGRRDDVFVVSKVYPHNASRAGTVAACERSLKRLATDRIDLYLLHWPGRHPLEETVAAFEQLKRAGKIRSWGVSNFDISEIEALDRIAGGAACATNQVLYNLARRGIEGGLASACAARKMPIMAYSPLDQARIPRKSALSDIARRHNASQAQIMLAWAARDPTTIVIPKATGKAHLAENIAAMGLRLDAADLAALDAAFPPPRGATPLEML